MPEKLSLLFLSRARYALIAWFSGDGPGAGAEQRPGVVRLLTWAREDGALDDDGLLASHPGAWAAEPNWTASAASPTAVHTGSPCSPVENGFLEPRLLTP
jgi:hypothetical protein